MLTPSNKDLTLAVYDRPVQSDEGVRLSDILGMLEVADWRPDVKEIPHILIVLDACFSGNATLGPKPIVYTQNNVQRVEEIEGTIVPKQIAILAATSDGDNSSAYELKGTKYSAFGFYFARALKEDWPCSDAWADGILTLSELRNYLTKQLRAAYQGASGERFTEGLMSPSMLNRDDNAFIAYSPEHYHEAGLRDEIIELEIQPPNDIVAEVTLPSGNTLTCGTIQANALGTCSVQISKSLAGNISVTSMNTAEFWQRYQGYTASTSSTSVGEVAGTQGEIVGTIFGHRPPPPPPHNSTSKYWRGDMGQLIQSKQANAAGVLLSVK
jgi:hypothetical protein